MWWKRAAGFWKAGSGNGGSSEDGDITDPKEPFVIRCQRAQAEHWWVRMLLLFSGPAVLAAGVFLLGMYGHWEKDTENGIENGAAQEGVATENDRGEEIKKAAECCRDIYEKASAEGKLGSPAVIEEMVHRLGENGYAATDVENRNWVNLTHPELVEAFCRQVERGKAGEAVIFAVMEDGGLICFWLEAEPSGQEADEADVFVTRSVVRWKGGRPEMDYVNRYRAQEWEYSENGYLFFRQNVPQGYDGAQGYTAIRVKPLEEKCLEFNRKYIMPVGYGSNDMFLKDWTEENLETLDFDDLFEKLYPSVYGVPIPYEKTVDGAVYYVPAEEYETVVLSYFPIERTALRANQEYLEKEGMYQYRTRGFYDYGSSPNIPYPEVVSYEEKEDGSLKLTIRAVWPAENLEQAFCHEVMIRPSGDGGFRYLSNHVIPSEDNVEPSWYMEKFTEEERKELGID